jgi:4-hydroxysphinganine ceramide fatty acyl 2-hydroxylase
MPGRTLPTIPTAEVRSHNNEKSCYVTIGTKVYDVTDFLDGHPGGGELILEYGGQDVEKILKDEVSHFHSDSAYEILEDSLVGFMATEAIMNGATKSSRPGEILPLLPTEAGKADLKSMSMDGKPLYLATGMSSAEDLSKETDPDRDYKEHKFLDLSKPLLMQIWNGGFSKDFYLEQVHRPRHYKGGDSAPLFGNFLEPLSKTPWWVVPSLWWPCVAIGTSIAMRELTVPATAGYWIFGLGFWTIIEYTLHRCLFHLDEYALSFPLHYFLLTTTDIFQTTELASPCISSFTVSIITSLWTSTGLSCHLRFLPRSPRLSGNLPTPSSSGTGMRHWLRIAAASLATLAMI